MRHILHADLDAFYASVEQRDNPALRGKPVVVGGRPEGRGVVAAASYEARRFGIRSAMPMRTALGLCPQVIRAQPRFDVYGQVSQQIMEIFRRITTLVEPLSLDEAYLDVTGHVTSQRSPRDIAVDIKRWVSEELSLTVSVGVASCKSVAKIASDMNKPDGLTVVSPGTERDFLAPLSVAKLWGIGPRTVERLAAEGVRTVGELSLRPEEWFATRFGKVGPHLRRLAMGLDDRPVVVERETKSVSAETTLAQDSDDPKVLLGLVVQLSRRVADRLERGGLQGRTVKLKLRLADFTTFTRQDTLSDPVGSTDALIDAAGALLRVELDPGRLFRLVGVGVSGFDRPPRGAVRQPRLAGFE